MADDSINLMEAARRYFDAMGGDGDRGLSQVEVERFVRWCGADRTFDKIRGQEVANYAEKLSGTATDTNRRADAVRKFLAFAKKEGFSSTNLGTHLRVRKTGSTKIAVRTVSDIPMSITQKVLLEDELASLKTQRPGILLDLQRAMADKDFRENAPLDAARQQQAYVEGRIRAIETKLDHAVVVEDSVPTGSHVIEVGSTVVLRNLSTNAETTYALVRPGEVKAAEGRISFESPVGRALLSHAAGDEVDVTVPSGTIRFRVERIEG